MSDGQAKFYLAVGGTCVLATGAAAAVQAGSAAVGWVLVALAWVAGAGAVWAWIHNKNQWRQEQEQREQAGQTQMQALQQQLVRVRAASQAVLDSLPHAVVLVSPNGGGGRIEMANEETRMFGIELGQLVDAVPHAWFKKLVMEASQARMPGSGGGKWEGPEHNGGNERNGGSKDALVQMFSEGRELFFRPQATPLIDAKGQFLGVVVILMDVTAMRAVDEAKSSLLSSFSHELKTPMTSLQMSIYLLLDDAASRLTPRQMELLTAARDDADRLHRLVEEVLSAARKKL
jgi:NtrC-family two-component system sensor histidine kinase KinB